MSVISPRKLYELQQLYDKACGELQVLTTKEYALDQRHLILLRGYELQGEFFLSFVCVCA